jgi:hypothetical protein
MDLNDKRLADSPEAFDRAIRIVQCPRTQWHLNLQNVILTIDIFDFIESPRDWLTRLYGEVETPLALAHEEVDKFTKFDGYSDSAHAWENALRSSNIDKKSEFLHYGGDAKELPARDALHRCLLRGADLYKLAWRHLVRDACVNENVFTRLSIFLGGTEVESKRWFDIFMTTRPLTTEELAGIDALNKQDLDCSMYDTARAWRDMCSVRTYEAYEQKCELYGTSPSKMTYASFCNRYDKPGISNSDAYSKLWFEVDRWIRSSAYYSNQEREAEARSLAEYNHIPYTITRDADITPHYDQHYFSPPADLPSLEDAFASASLDAVETLGLPPLYPLFPLIPSYDFGELGATPDYD